MKHKKKTAVAIFTLVVLALGAGRFFAPAENTAPAIGVPEATAGEEQKKQQYTCGMHPFIIQDEPGDCPICGMELTPVKSGTAGGAAAPSGERKIKYWVAPMDPTYIRDKPGKSPMGMDLVPVYEDEAATGQVISIDPVTVQNMGVRTTTVSRRDISHTIRTVGLVDYQEPLQYSVNTKISGWVEKLHINETGQKVEKGAPLLDIYSPELVSAQEEFLLALNNEKRLGNSPFAEIRAGARRLLEASRNRLALWDISAAQIKALEEQGRVQKNLTLYAPYSGIVTTKKVNEGMFVKPGMELFTISDISRVWVQADIYEYELPWLAVGQKAKVILPFAGNRTLSGTVTYIYPYVEARTRTVKARLEFDNPDMELKPDMYVNVRIKTRPRQAVLAVPGDAILNSGDSRTVFVALGNGKFEPRQVKIGLSGEDGYVEILQGLLPGEQVVTSAQFMLDSESTLRAAIQKMLESRKKPAENTPPSATREEDLDELFQ